MLLIPCPHCGERDETEFAHGGAVRHMPALDGQSDAGDWHKALHLRDRVEGPRAEYWYHHAGCERWIALTRHMRSHRFVGGGL